MTLKAINYDLVVIGSGPAGEKGAAQAAYFGKKVALVEKRAFLGGAAASTTIPSKTLRETSLTLSGIRARKLHGVNLSLSREATAKDFLHHERKVKKSERERVRINLENHKIDVYKGHGSFLDPHTIKVVDKEKETFLKAKKILIATGSSPRRPNDFPRDDRIYDSDTILNLEQIPGKMVVVGGGVIGCEYACIFAQLGIDVSLIHNSDVFLAFLDEDLSIAIEKIMLNSGIALYKSDGIVKIDLKKKNIDLDLKSGKNISADAIMLATGRSSNTSELNLEAAGIKTGKYGRLVVDENYQVVDPKSKNKVADIYAAGDIIGPPSLASTSMEQARYAMIKAFNLEPYKEDVAPVLPVGIYTIPECALAGKTEKECIQEGIDFVVGKASYKDNARGMIIGDSEGFLKVIYEFNSDLNKPMKLLGVHIIGEIASELIHYGVGALILKASSNIFIDTCYNYPTLSELYKYATYDAMGNRAKRVSAE